MKLKKRKVFPLLMNDETEKKGKYSLSLKRKIKCSLAIHDNPPPSAHYENTDLLRTGARAPYGCPSDRALGFVFCN
jgi:hypothetical protein